MNRWQFIPKIASKGKKIFWYTLSSSFTKKIFYKFKVL